MYVGLTVVGAVLHGRRAGGRLQHVLLLAGERIHGDSAQRNRRLVDLQHERTTTLTGRRAMDDTLEMEGHVPVNRRHAPLQHGVRRWSSAARGDVV